MLLGRYKFNEEQSGGSPPEGRALNREKRLVPLKNEKSGCVFEEKVVEGTTGDTVVLWSFTARVTNNINPRLCRYVLDLVLFFFLFCCVPFSHHNFCTGRGHGPLYTAERFFKPATPRN